jgi:hypothetical protein
MDCPSFQNLELLAKKVLTMFSLESNIKFLKKEKEYDRYTPR